MLNDLRYALRTLRMNRLFAAMAMLSLALGIGANTAIYSFMDAILVRTLPVRDPGSLVVLQWHGKGRHGRGLETRLLPAPDGSGYEPGAVTNESATLLVRAMIAAASQPFSTAILSAPSCCAVARRRLSGQRTPR